MLVALAFGAVLATQAGQNGLLPLAGLVIALAGILQALPYAMGELGFQFDLGRARWSRLMGEAADALERGDLELATTRLEAAHRDATRSPSPRPVLAAESAGRLADVMERADRPADAERWLAESLRRSERVPGPDDPKTRKIRDRLVDLRTRMGDGAGARALLEAQVQSLSRTDGQGGAATAAAGVRVAASLAAQGRDADAQARYVECLAQLEGVHGAHHWSLVDALLGLADLRRRAATLPDAEGLIQRALGNAHMAGQTELTNRAREALIDLYVAQERYAEVVPISEAWLRTQEAGAAGSDRRASVERMQRHASVLALAGNEEQATRYRRRADLLRAALDRNSAGG
jgi:hypothetical protein